jgi:signal transduction histidine kinase
MRDADAVSNQARTVMYLLGVGGPLSGIIIGFGVARGLSRSIYQLSVRVQNISQRLDQDVASVSVAADGDIQHLDTQLQHIVSKVEEVAERLQRQQRDMLRAEQLSAVGQLAASVAHEIRNPLSGVKLLVEAARRPRNPLPLTAEDLDVIHGEIARVEQTVQGLLDFARLPKPARQRCDVRPLITRAIDLVQSRARQQQVELTVHCAEEPLVSDVDPNQLGTVFVNLLLNALDAMPKGGKLEVVLHRTDDSVRCVVNDTGSGIPPEMVDLLFVPFCSSKPTGTGLGLSICRRILDEHGGHITAENRGEGGARFTVTIPCAPADLETPALVAAAPTAP